MSQHPDLTGPLLCELLGAGRVWVAMTVRDDAVALPP